MLARFHAEQVWSGRWAGLDKELALAAGPGWDAAALAEWTAPDIRLNAFPEVHAPPFWLDYAALVARWNGVFGHGAVRLRPYDAALFAGREVTREIAGARSGCGDGIGKAEAQRTLRRRPRPNGWRAARQVNALFERVLATGRVIPRLLWRRMLAELAVPGPAIAAGSLSPVSRHFAACQCRAGAGGAGLWRRRWRPTPPCPTGTDEPPGGGFRATQYLTVFMPRIDKATADAKKAAVEQAARKQTAGTPVLSAQAEKLLPPLAKATFADLAGGRFAPHNRIGRVNEEELAAPYAPMPPRRAARRARPAMSSSAA